MTARDVGGRLGAEAALRESRDLLESILGAVGDGITVLDGQGGFVYVNGAAAALLGFSSAEEFLRTPPDEVLARYELLTEDGAPIEPERLPSRRVLLGEESAEEIVRYRSSARNEDRFSHVRSLPVRGPDGETRFVINVFHDVTEERRGERRLRFLAEASVLLSADLDYETTLAALAHVVVPRIAEWYAVDLLDEDGSLRRIATAQVDAEGLLDDRDSGEAARRVLESGEPELREPGDGSGITAPLVARGRAFGALSVVRAPSRRRFGPADVEFVQELALRVATAVENARLYRDTSELASLLDTLFASAPVGLAFFDRELRFVRVNEALAAVNGRSVADHLGRTLDEIAPVLDAGTRAAYDRVLATGEPALGLESHGPSAGRPDRLAAWSVSIYPVRDADGSIAGVGAVVADETERTELLRREREAQARLGFLAEASGVLGRSLDYQETLSSLAELIVPKLADFCAVHFVTEDDSLETVSLVAADPEWQPLSQEAARRRRLPTSAQTGVASVVRAGEPQLFAEVTQELVDRLAAERPGQEQALQALVGGSALSVPLLARGRALGAITLISTTSGRRYDEGDLAFVQELASRVAVAVDNALVFAEAEERAQAARILQSVGDGVFLVDGDGVVRYWNRAAEAITGLAAHGLIDRPAGDAIPGWEAVGPLVAVGAPAQSVPLQLGDRELWLSISGVALEEGTVYAFRDLTEDRAIEELKADFVSTVSHELRTPLAAIYGAAMTLRREDVRLEDDQRDTLLAVVASESDRLARTVNDILWASRLDAGNLNVAIESCDPVELTRVVVAAQQAHLPAGVELALDAEQGLPPVAADPDKVRQVLVNLLDNAVKYSPDGGRVRVAVERRAAHLRFSVSDEGLGIPYGEQRRIFEKFYRLDPNLTRGVGGTGLGLYICRELTRRMNGRVSLASEPGRGSTFVVELPVAGGEEDVRAHLMAP